MYTIVVTFVMITMHFFDEAIFPHTTTHYSAHSSSSTYITNATILLIISFL